MRRYCTNGQVLEEKCREDCRHLVASLIHEMRASVYGCRVLPEESYEPIQNKIELTNSCNNDHRSRLCSDFCRLPSEG